jgi:hypothetical protein
VHTKQREEGCVYYLVDFYKWEIHSKGKGKAYHREEEAPRKMVLFSNSSINKFEELHCKLEDKLGLYQVPCVFTFCSIFFQISIYIYIYIFLVFPMGVFLGSC